MVNSSRALVESLTSHLKAFTRSPDLFRILFTLPHSTTTSSPEPRPSRPTSPIHNLIVLDSSFNPPTTAHASMVRSVITSPSDRVLLLLAVENADKAAKPASFPLRLAMMEGFGREIRRDTDVDVDVGVTKMPFFHDKARVIGESGFYDASGEAGEMPGMVFLAGYDTLIRIFQPRYYGGEEVMRRSLDPFFGTSRLRVTMRTDGAWGGREEQEGFVRDLEAEGGGLVKVGGRREWMDKVSLVEGFGDGVSSSGVREVVKTGGEIGGMVGDEVKGWIEREGLYKA